MLHVDLKKFARRQRWGVAPIVFWAATSVCGTTQAQSAAPAASQVVMSGLSDPIGLAVNAQGDVFAANDYTAQVSEWTPTGAQNLQLQGIMETNGYHEFQAEGMAVDQSGNLFVCDFANNRVVKIAPGNIQTTAVSGLNEPIDVAVDAAGNLYIADFGSGRALKVTPSGAQTVLNVGGVVPRAIAVDKAGHVFVGTQAYVVEATPNGPVAYLKGQASFVTGVAADNEGNLFVTDKGAGVLWEVPLSGAQPVAVAQDLQNPGGVAVDALGNVFYSELDSNTVSKLAFSANFGNQTIGSPNFCTADQTGCTSSQTWLYTVTADGDVSASMASNGSPAADFGITASTCQGFVPAGTKCSVTVTFSPQAPGLRRDAVRLTGGNGETIASTYVYGQGVGPTLVFAPKTSSESASVMTPTGLTTDTMGNIYVADDASGSISEVLPSGGTWPLMTGLSQPHGIAFDGAGNLYIANAGKGTVLKVTAAAGGSTAPIGGTFLNPWGLAVDGSGNVYVADEGSRRVVKISSTGTTVSLGTGWIMPTGVAVDASGNLFVADGAQTQIVKIAPNGKQSLVPGEVSGPTGVAVDAAGNLYVSKAGSGIVEIAPDGSESVLGQSYPGYSDGVTLDDSGNIYFNHFSNGGATNGVAVLTRSSASLVFTPTQAVGSVSAPMDLTVENAGNAPLTLNALTMPAGFERLSGPGAPADCEADSALAMAESCDISISFAPQSTGATAGALRVSASAPQSVKLQGTAN